MSTAQATYHPQADNSNKMLFAMVGIGLLCALLIVLTYEGTKPAIKKNKAEALERAIFKVVPGIETKQTFQLNERGEVVFVNSDEEVEGPVFHAGYTADGSLKGIAIEASGMGFADVLRILYGYDPQREEIIGFHVLESKETPGLGDKIEKDDDFLANFSGLDVGLNDSKTGLENTVVPVKSGEKEHPWQVDGITGATISSWAIGDIIGTSTQNWIPKLYQVQEELAEKGTANE